MSTKTCNQRRLDRAMSDGFTQGLKEYTRCYGQPLILEAALRNRIFDLLDRGPKSVQDVAAVNDPLVAGLSWLLDTLAVMKLMPPSKPQSAKVELSAA